MTKTNGLVLLLVLVCSLTVTSTWAKANCGKYERPIINAHGEVRCIPKPASSCEGTPDYVEDDSCDERGPCFDHRICYYKYLRTECYPDACNRCQARVYDHLYNEVCQNEL
ncbi:hypothetical protein M3Y94_00622700 [Aphelenchoides besseyi]|nr:hypothetical protein M3Y94_00622700 [Aphelenchoides besseyi]KAI6218941.1 hypothetical protein M3Y95_01141700 [Aphelenchoides besseyi]